MERTRIKWIKYNTINNKVKCDEANWIVKKMCRNNNTCIERRIQPVEDNYIKKEAREFYQI